MTPSPDQLRSQIERGNACRELLGSEAFKTVVDELTSFHLAALVACRPGHSADADALAYHHACQHALADVVSTLTQYDATGRAAQEALDWSAQHGDED